MQQHLIQFETRQQMQHFLQEMAVVSPAVAGPDYLDDELGNDLISTFARPQVSFDTAFQDLHQHICRRYDDADRQIIERAIMPISAYVHSHLQWLMQSSGLSACYHSWNGLCLRALASVAT